MRALLALLTLALAALPLAPAAPARAQADPAAELLALANQARVAAGLLPLRASQELAAAAQRHSDDLAAAGALSHTGSDGSRPDGRIRSAGYPAYGGAGLYASENIFRGASPAEAVEWWLGDASSQGNLLNPDFREAGVGLATGAGGEIYFTMTFGARPNSLPVFIAGDAPETDGPAVDLALSNETVQPGGEGTGVIGRATEVRISNEPGFPSAVWQPWAATIGWTLAPGAGLKTIYVQFRDAQGRTTAATDSITLTGAGPTGGSPAGATPTRGAPGTRAATATPGGPAPAVTAVPPAGTPPASSQPGTPAASPESGGAPDSSGPDVPPAALAAACGLQVLAVLLTGYLVLRRS
jgi:uncharacterized protein YkwD